MVVLTAIGVTVGVFVALAGLLILAEKWLVNYGTCVVNLNDGEKTFELSGGGTLLEALREQGVLVPSACAGKGTCGYCKVVVSEGGGPVLRTEMPYLSRPEVRANYRLACQVKVKSDMDVRVPDFLTVVKRMVANRSYNPDQKWRFIIE